MILTVNNYTVGITEHTNLVKPFLSVKMDGYQYSEAYKNGRWDGTYYFLSYNRFPTGFLPSVLKLLKANGINDITLIDERDNMPIFDTDFNPSIIGDFELRDYQIDIIKKCNNILKEHNFLFPRGIINGATNAGKSIIAVGIVKSIINCKCLFLVHNKLLYNQSIKYFSEFFDVGEINASTYKVKDFTVGMFQTLSNRIKDSGTVQYDLTNSFNTLIVDEAHRAGSKEYASLINSINTGGKYFISGTTLKNDSEYKNLLILGLSGKILAKIDNKALIEKGVSRDPIVNLHYINEVNNYLPDKFSYVEEQDSKIHYSLIRAVRIIDIIKENTDKYILLSFKNIEHGKYLKDLIEKHIPDLKLGFIYGLSDDRQEMLDKFINKEINLLISSLILKEGINLPNIDMLILSQGGKSEITTIQLIGRALRAKKDCNTVIIHDFYDDGKYITTHSKARIKTYIDEGFNIVTHYKSDKRFNPLIIKK